MVSTTPPTGRLDSVGGPRCRAAEGGGAGEARDSGSDDGDMRLAEPRRARSESLENRGRLSFVARAGSDRRAWRALRMKMRPSGVARISSLSRADEAVGAEIFQLGDFGREIFVEGDSELLLDFSFADYGVAEEAADYFAAKDVVLGEAIAAQVRDAAAATAEA